MRIPGATNPLDASSVHPESYALVEEMAKDVQASLEELIKNAELRKKINKKKYISENLGSIIPNTALLIITAGKKRYQLFLSSTETKSAKVRFVYDKTAAEAMKAEPQIQTVK